jgi:hypothetical protein
MQTATTGGYVKVVAPAPGKVVFVHQLNNDGTPYAEDVTIEAQPGVDPGRVDWTARDGQVGSLSWSFSQTNGSTGLKFPGDEEPQEATS